MMPYRIFLLSAMFFIAACNNTSEKTASQNTVIQVTSDTAPDSNLIQKPEVDTLQVSVPSDKKIDLKLNLNEGNRYEFVSEGEVIQGGEAQKMSTGITFSYDLQVLSSKGGVFTIKTTYNHISMVMGMGGQQMELNSEQGISEGTNPLQMLSNMFASLKGQSFILKLNQQGKVVDVSGIDKIGDLMISKLGLPEEKKTQALRTFKSQFNEEQVKSSFESAFDIYPSHAVTIGDSWKKQTTTGVGPLKGKMETTYTAKKFENGNLTVAGQGTLKTDNGENTGTQNSQLVVNVATGLVLKNNFELKLSGGQNLVSRGKTTARLKK